MVHFDFSGKKGACNIRVQIEPSDAVTTSGHSLLQTALQTQLLTPSCSQTDTRVVPAYPLVYLLVMAKL